MNENTVVTLAWSVVAIFGISQFTIYSLVRLIVTGKPIFQAKGEQEPRSRVIEMGR